MTNPQIDPIRLTEDFFMTVQKTWFFVFWGVNKVYINALNQLTKIKEDQQQ